MNTITAAIDRYTLIAQNQPVEAASVVLARNFLQKANIQGSPEFIDRVRKVVHKASITACGSEILNRVFRDCSQIKIREADACKYSWIDHCLELNFGKVQGIVMCCNFLGNKMFSPQKRVPTLVHELLHYWHAVKDAQAFFIRLDHKLDDGMDNAEEKLTIAGDEADSCCENTARLELGLPARINHIGYEVIKQTPLNLPDLLSNQRELKKIIFKDMIHDWMSLLHRVAMVGNFDTFNALLSVMETPEEINAALSCTDKFGRTALHFAAKYGNVVVINVILAALDPKGKKVALEKTDGDGMTATQLAFHSGNVDALKALTTVLSSIEEGVVPSSIVQTVSSPTITGRGRMTTGPLEFVEFLNSESDSCGPCRKLESDRKLESYRSMEGVKRKRGP